MIARRVCLAAFLAALSAPATAHAVASAELFKNQAYRYGRFEARIRYAPGDGVISSFFLWKVGSEVSGAYWNELDFEKLGADCRMQTNTLYGNPLMSAEQTRTMPVDMCDAYHDYRFEWTPTYIAWFIDAQEIRRETGAVATAFADNTPEGMRVHFNVWPGNANFGGNFNPSILPVRQYISWAQYSSFQNGTFRVEWREDFDGSSVPSGWTTGTWASPLNLSTHDARNVTFSNGIAVLSLSADNATGFTGTPPADNAGGMAGRGGASTGGANAGATSGGASTGGTAGGGSSAGGSKASGGAAGGSSFGGGATSGGAASGGAAGANQTGNGGATTGGTPNAGTANVGAGNSSVSSGGAFSGGAPTAGIGNPTTGGANGTGGSSTGNPSGGTLSGGSASGGATSGAAPAAGNSGADPSNGCGCRLAPAPRSHALAVGLGLLTAWMARRRARAQKRLRDSST